MEKTQGVTELFRQLALQNIEVLSLRNKTNRLEELFVSLVEKNLAGGCGMSTHLSELRAGRQHGGAAHHRLP